MKINGIVWKLNSEGEDFIYLTNIKNKEVHLEDSRPLPEGHDFGSLKYGQISLVTIRKTKKGLGVKEAMVMQCDTPMDKLIKDYVFDREITLLLRYMAENHEEIEI